MPSVPLRRRQAAPRRRSVADVLALLPLVAGIAVFLYAVLTPPAHAGSRPETTITAGPAAGSTVTSLPVTFAFTGTGSWFECSLDAGAWSACTSPRSFSQLANGTRTFRVRAVSSSGVRDRSPASRSFTVSVGTGSGGSTACLRAGAAAVSRITTWRPVGSLPLSDAAAAAKVGPQAERRAGNATPNGFCPAQPQLDAFYAAKDWWGQSLANPGSTFNVLRKYVTGRFTGTTDEIISWAAWKWGIPEDWLRAQYVNESWWRHETLGDRATVSDPLMYPSQARIAGTSDVYESMGLTQVKWRPDGSMHTGTEPLRWQSTAFNVDYQASVVRYYYDDPNGARSNWGNDPGYRSGDPWLSLGGWYSPSPWGNSGQLAYVDRVRQHLAARTWEGARF
ncbi:MAG TPA: hypothetical protein VD931_21020 [Baekduia sp.]|nr:hypothetical protein [Baekduia sp.]